MAVCKLGVDRMGNTFLFAKIHLVTDLSYIELMMVTASERSVRINPECTIHTYMCTQYVYIHAYVHAITYICSS